MSSTVTSKQIINLQKQNDGIYKSLTSKGITFNRVNISPEDSEEIQLQKLSEENTELKKISNANKPPPVQKESVPKEEKPKVVQQAKKPKKDDDDDESDQEIEEKKKFTTIANMESMKISFFGNDYAEFKRLAKSEPYLFFKVSYKYNSDKDGVPTFNAKNLIKGFVKSFDDQRKLFMNCFRCYQTQSSPSKYEYVGFWIVNTLDPLNEVISDTIENFEMIKISEETNIDTFLSQMEKLVLDENEELPNGCIEEAYVH